MLIILIIKHYITVNIMLHKWKSEQQWQVVCQVTLLPLHIQYNILVIISVKFICLLWGTSSVLI